MRNISQDKSPQQILSLGERFNYPQRAQYKFLSYGQAQPMFDHVLYESNLCSHSNCSWSLAEVFVYYDSPQITLKNLTNQEVATFTYGEWLSKLKNDRGSLECEMPAVINDEQMMEDTTYTLQVKTSDVGGTV